MRHIKIDKTNARMLQILQEDGRLSNQKLAKQLNISPSPCLQRRKHLEERGVIAGYSAHIDLEKIAKVLLVSAEVTLANNKVKDERAFETYLNGVDEIISAYAVGGRIDYVLLFCVPSLEQYQTLSEALLEANPVIETLTSHVVMREVKQSKGWPLAVLLNQGD